MPLTITENTSIDYDVHGEGPPLLLINGLGFGRWGWFKQVPAFTRHFRTITCLTFSRPQRSHVGRGPPDGF